MTACMWRRDEFVRGYQGEVAKMGPVHRMRQMVTMVTGAVEDGGRGKKTVPRGALGTV